ncbi:ATP-binding protein [Acidiphilium acidophilum]|uniref:histidine kinase n=1 Tax=Acidiphilium acidophilum TaxID=76588 RepID=A0AAW9DTB9_ACIAO|nr:ATP-binding protein [Acidiphilium acidophilum]MDX5931593.1 ATP-binding protein [Acidiphilium acidophilum]
MIRRRGFTTMQRAVLLLLGLFIATEATVVVLFHVYVIEPAATRFAEILIDATQAPALPARSTPGAIASSGQRLLFSREAAPGHLPNNYFLAQTARDIASMTGGGQMRISPDLGARKGIVWIRRPGAPAWIGFPVSRFNFGASNFVLLRLIVLFGFTFLGSVVIVREINRPLARLAALAHQWGKGDQIFEMAPFGGPDEIRQVETAIRGMAADLRALYDEHSVLLTGISHELRTPLSRLLLVLHLPDAKLLAHKQAMFDDVAEMDETLRKFLALVRNDSQERSMTASLAPFLAEMSEIGRERYNLDVVATLPDLPPVAFKPLALERLVRNLFDNSARYGADAIRITAVTTAESVKLAFTDNGPGLPTADETDDAFSARSARSGSGVGMLLCRRIATLHGGSIEFVNAPEGGLSACLTLPRADVRRGLSPGGKTESRDRRRGPMVT